MPFDLDIVNFIYNGVNLLTAENRNINISQVNLVKVKIGRGLQFKWDLWFELIFSVTYFAHLLLSSACSEAASSFAMASWSRTSVVSKSSSTKRMRLL